MDMIVERKYEGQFSAEITKSPPDKHGNNQHRMQFNSGGSAYFVIRDNPTATSTWHKVTVFGPNKTSVRASMRVTSEKAKTFQFGAVTLSYMNGRLATCSPEAERLTEIGFELDGEPQDLTEMIYNMAACSLYDANIIQWEGEAERAARAQYFEGRKNDQS